MRRPIRGPTRRRTVAPGSPLVPSGAPNGSVGGAMAGRGRAVPTLPYSALIR